MLDNLQTAIYEIKHQIKINSDIRKLLYYDTRDALLRSEVSILDIDPYIFLSPVFEINSTPPYDKTTFISIHLAKGETDDEENLLNSVLRINILTRNDLWEINNQKIRPLEIANLIIKELDNRKVAISNKLFFVSVESSILDKNTTGYILLFGLVEGGGLEDEF